MTETSIDFTRITKGELAKIVYDGDISGIDFAIPQYKFDLMMSVGFNPSMCVMSYKGRSTYGQLVHLFEALMERTYPEFEPYEFFRPGDHGVPMDIASELQDNGISVAWWALRYFPDERVYRPVNVAQDIVLEKNKDFEL